MTFSTLPLSYCTNVHPAQSIADVDRGLDDYTLRVRQQFGHPLAAGLWLAQPVIAELLADEQTLQGFADRLAARDLPCYTLNAFPYGNFHSARVKEQVYLPDWAAESRRIYTQRCAAVLATLLPDAGEGSLSTVPLAFKALAGEPDRRSAWIGQLLECARFLRDLRESTGKTVRLAIEPEPFCVLETTAETVQFFDELWARAAELGDEVLAREFLGVCFDVCHQAVEFENIPDSIAQLVRAGIRLNKVHLTCALQVRAPGENPAALEALATYVEDRYLHQTIGRLPNGQLLRRVDLSLDFVEQPGSEWLACDMWRVHFHVPVDAERLGPLETTRTELRQVLSAIRALDYAPHLEVETYTWSVLPADMAAEGPRRLVEGLAAELRATRDLLS